MAGCQPSDLAVKPASARLGVIGGIMALATTLAANLWILLVGPADLCRFGPLAALLFDVGALIVFVLLAAAVGMATGRAVGSVGQATLAGVLFGVIAGVALLLTVPFAPAVTHRLQEVDTLCPQTSAIRGGGGGSFSFSFGPTPPSGVVLPTPPPGFFITPPPVGFESSPFGVAVALPSVIGLLATVVVGTGLAAGTAALGGLIGVASRPRSATSSWTPEGS